MVLMVDSQVFLVTTGLLHMPIYVDSGHSVCLMPIFNFQYSTIQIFFLLATLSKIYYIHVISSTLGVHECSIDDLNSFMFLYLVNIWLAARRVEL